MLDASDGAVVELVAIIPASGFVTMVSGSVVGCVAVLCCFLMQATFVQTNIAAEIALEGACAD